MTEVNFYHLVSSSLEAALPKLLEKVVASGQKAVVLAASPEQMEVLNTLLWTYSTRTFIPHGSRMDAFPQEQPIYITDCEENPAGATILVLTNGQQPVFLPTFERCLDLFDGNSEEEVARARKRWSHYKKEHAQLSYFQQNAKGGWEKK